MPKLATKLCARPLDKGSPCLRGLEGVELAAARPAPMLISSACMSEKVPVEMCLPFRCREELCLWLASGLGSAEPSSWAPSQGASPAPAPAVVGSRPGCSRREFGSGHRGEAERAAAGRGPGEVCSSRRVAVDMSMGVQCASEEGAAGLKARPPETSAGHPSMALGSVTGQPLFSFSENGDTPESRVLPRSLPGIQTGAGLGQARSEEGSRVDRRMRSPSCGRGSQGPGWRRLPSLSFLQGPTPLAGWRRAPPPFAPSSPRRPVGCSGQASGKQNLFAVHISTPEAVGQDAGRLPELALQASRS
ncbi:uncharacterized protein [Dasypus novemcinctus]|uniref:uncharacterized protein isoform X1 n=1 Tax=Dasypus novemcinctus TaxID=9361 RepID=UPI000328F58C|nr:uncharacterized protein LOC101417831 isoform X1 [Dasypus novemcinctus]XP_058150656.1 uncharacterized protein LOC101417831 isoform X1 [Dasypus novemcinctus]XP_058150657.1 uncharacterized protein LOC101417831 isoform X1 [Dasypus novemcinctus]XP_058150658.1 uncharacterized protein LOC101417831 isoform X1 [Dasypus novemcinctus]XP_058150659.1 uncharacterized protein LOC101417831 isoform X1 [Dasypus novemcinctus]